MCVFQWFFDRIENHLFQKHVQCITFENQLSYTHITIHVISTNDRIHLSICSNVDHHHTTHINIHPTRDTVVNNTNNREANTSLRLSFSEETLEEVEHTCCTDVCRNDNTISYRIVSHRIVLYCIVSHRILLYCIVLYCIVSYCIDYTWFQWTWFNIALFS